MNLIPLKAGPAPAIPGEPFHPTCRIFDMNHILRRDFLLRQRGEATKADALKNGVIRALCYPHQPPVLPGAMGGSS